MATARPVIAFAMTLQLECPHCGETYPSPDGSLFWTTEEVQLNFNGQTIACDSCDEKFKLVVPSRAAIQLPLIEASK